jgi:hypothetical protein
MSLDLAVLRAARSAVGVLLSAAATAALLLLTCTQQSVRAQDGLPTVWTQGIATFYGGAPDGMVGPAPMG